MIHLQVRLGTTELRVALSKCSVCGRVFLHGASTTKIVLAPN